MSDLPVPIECKGPIKTKSNQTKPNQIKSNQTEIVVSNMTSGSAESLLVYRRDMPEWMLRAESEWMPRSFLYKKKCDLSSAGMKFVLHSFDNYKILIDSMVAKVISKVCKDAVLTYDKMSVDTNSSCKMHPYSRILIFCECRKPIAKTKPTIVRHCDGCTCNVVSDGEVKPMCYKYNQRVLCFVPHVSSCDGFCVTDIGVDHNFSVYTKNLEVFASLTRYLFEIAPNINVVKHVLGGEFSGYAQASVMLALRLSCSETVRTLPGFKASFMHGDDLHMTWDATERYIDALVKLQIQGAYFLSFDRYIQSCKTSVRKLESSSKVIPAKVINALVGTELFSLSDQLAYEQDIVDSDIVGVMETILEEPRSEVDILRDADFEFLSSNVQCIAAAMVIKEISFGISEAFVNIVRNVATFYGDLKHADNFISHVDEIVQRYHGKGGTIDQRMISLINAFPLLGDDHTRVFLTTSGTMYHTQSIIRAKFWVSVPAVELFPLFTKGKGLNVGKFQQIYLFFILYIALSVQIGAVFNAWQDNVWLDKLLRSYLSNSVSIISLVVRANKKPKPMPGLLEAMNLARRQDETTRRRV